MLSKLFKGELSLKATFWKFGILGLIILKLAVRIFGSLLAGHIKGVSIVEFFTRYFHPIYSSKLSILWTLCYLLQPADFGGVFLVYYRSRLEKFRRLRQKLVAAQPCPPVYFAVCRRNLGFN